MKKGVIWVFSIMMLSGCAATLNQAGAKVRLVNENDLHKCDFLGVVTSSNSMGYSTG